MLDAKRRALFCGLILLGQGQTGMLAIAQDVVRIAPASGDVELEEIHVVRRTSLGAVKNADLTNMRVGLWFAADWQRNDGPPPLIHLLSLHPIEDDTGRLLSTEARVKQVEHLQGEVRGRSWRGGTGAKQGPVISLELDAPARGAGKIKAIKGKAQVTLTKAVSLTFKDLSAINGKELDHPDMKGLAAMKLRFAIEEKDGRVSARLSAPVNYASPWFRGRLDDWEVMDGEKKVSQGSEWTKGEGDGVTVEKTYRRRTSEGLSLRLVVLESVESKTFDFSFQDVPLP